MTTTDGEILKRRVTAASPRGDHWNDWPSKLPIVSITEVDVTDPYKAHHYGYLVGSAMGGGGIMRQVASDLIPHEAKTYLSRYGSLYHIVTVRFTLAAPAGQSDDAETRNILALFDPKPDYDFTAHKQTFASPALIVSIGCQHVYNTEYPLGPNRGWAISVCKMCGHRVEVDSSD